jgi:hypothetical protein
VPLNVSTALPWIDIGDVVLVRGCQIRRPADAPAAAVVNVTVALPLVAYVPPLK